MLYQYQFPYSVVVKLILKCHFTEQTLEYAVLTEQCSYLCRTLAEKHREIDILDHRLRELLATKSQQDYERHRTQAALDNLNSCLRRLR